MHQRNIFREPPDHMTLAIKYKYFRKECKLELTGKVSIDYKNISALRALNQALLEEYFQLMVEFAPGTLVPTIPLRLNYILWIEDLLAETKKLTDVHGIDIGCGSSCIYSLLAARKNNWHMLALESNDLNISYATENIQRNDLHDLITIYKQEDNNAIFKNYFSSKDVLGKEYQFCLCNPPFYDAKLKDPFNAKTRNPFKRPAPHNVRTGGAEELTCCGGEVRFVKNIIEESLIYKEKICIFTSMLGHKKSLSTILDFLKTLNITSVTKTEFCQGNTTRWGVAWSFQVPLKSK